MSELKVHEFCESDEFVREYRGPLSNEMRPYYLKSEADLVLKDQEELIAKKDKEIAEKDEDIAELKAIDSKNRSAYYKDLAMMAKDVEHQKYKRCLLRSVIAEMNATHFKDLFYGAGSEALADEYNKQITIHYKWQKRWLALADKYGEGK